MITTRIVGFRGFEKDFHNGVAIYRYHYTCQDCFKNYELNYDANPNNDSNFRHRCPSCKDAIVNSFLEALGFGEDE